MADIMDEYTESPGDGDDVFPCKGCGEILEEGKAFELAGNRWHLDCFRCNTCNTLLDSDANLLLLGDGSLICNNCTYSCSACNNKIEDLAILTGDQAFCATCFRCRNCKRKIENLRYARTSHGIFCMSCHESLMARRRKKSKAAAQAKLREKDGSPMITDKSLPALPPNAIPPLTAFSSERVTPEPDPTTELSPRPRNAYTKADTSSRSGSRLDRSPERGSSEVGERSNLALPTQNYRMNRNSTIMSGELSTADGDGFFIPVALDPSPAMSVTPQSISETFSEATRKNQDYFSAARSSTSGGERRPESQASTPHIAFQDKGPHIAFQDKGRQASSDYESPQQPERPSRKLSKRKPAPSVAGERKSAAGNSQTIDEFKLQDAPRTKKLVSQRRNSQSSNNMSPGSESNESPPMLSAPDREATPRSSQDLRLREDVDMRPSMESTTSGRSEPNPKAISRKEVPAGAGRTANGMTQGSVDESRPSRPRLPEPKMSDTYMQPRAPPPPPGPSQLAREQTNSGNEGGEPKTSPKLPRWSAGGDFSMDEDMARILGTDEGSSSILRRVSNAVRHGRNNSMETVSNHGRGHHTRSVSETTRGTASPRWPKTPIAEDPTGAGAGGAHGHSHSHGHDISSPISLGGPAGAGAGASSHDDAAFLKRQLRNSENRVAELERQFNVEKDMLTMNKKIDEKRMTVSMLDSQAEIMIRQLETLALYLERAKKTREPIDPDKLADSAVKDFIQRLEQVKQNMSASIEKLYARHDELQEEKNHAVAIRDRALLEFEQLSSKNAQLADMNNDLTHQIQERFKQHTGANDLRSPNGLGIYSHSKGMSSVNNLDSASLQTGTTMVGTDGDEPTVEGPTVINIRKGQAKKFNWKKGKIGQNITKNFNRAAVAFQAQEQNQGQPRLTGDNIGLPYNMTQGLEPIPLTPQPPPLVPNRANTDNSRQGFAFFSKKGAQMPKSMSVPNMVSAPAPVEPPSTLFGSDLVERADYERRQIPSVVTRCIEEVELRGMDVEGIYRKTGGSSQVKMIQEGFDKNDDYDISDPTLDISAVTSALKQYLRKLPIPLLTYDVYDRFLESSTIPDPMDRCDHLRQTVNSLPPKHRDCLEFLMFHLARVASRMGQNKMTPSNLAVVFAPTIMRDTSLEREMTDMHAKNIAVQFLIENSHTIFGEA
ncbi:putative Rho-type GTPase-activating protein [Podospora conica]|nr:putative Rho-type GTPase-activating protein [Schizothecium conicum]